MTLQHMFGLEITNVLAHILFLGIVWVMYWPANHHRCGATVNWHFGRRIGTDGRRKTVTKRKPNGELPPTQRSAVTNGKRLFVEGGNMSGPWARRFCDVQYLHLSDLGGLPAASEAERSLVRRVAVITIELERLEAKLSEIEDPSPDILDLYQRLTNSLRRVLETLARGLSRRPRDVTPDLNSYLATEYEETEEAN
jgi:hypothetical protein